MEGFEVVGHMSTEPRLAGKVAVISGASRGFGQAIAVRFVEQGARVVMLSRSNCDETLGLIASIRGLTTPVAEVRRGDGRRHCYLCV
jgi:NAD(P)-dependent dehydrogenase (short-subunit alcohol dehydrogenase family)